MPWPSMANSATFFRRTAAIVKSFSRTSRKQASRRTPRPDSQQVNQVDAKRPQPFPFRDRNFGNPNLPAKLLAQTREPGKCADLVKLRMEPERSKTTFSRFFGCDHGLCNELSQALPAVVREEQRSLERIRLQVNRALEYYALRGFCYTPGGQ